MNEIYDLGVAAGATGMGGQVSDYALQARQITEEFIEDLTEYAMWLRNMDDHYSRQAVSRDLQQMAAYYTQRVNDPGADAQDTHPTLWGRLAWANRG